MLNGRKLTILCIWQVEDWPIELWLTQTILEFWLTFEQIMKSSRPNYNHIISTYQPTDINIWANVEKIQ